MMRFELQGLKEALQKLGSMDRSIKRRALRKGIRAGAAELRKTAKRYAPKSKSPQIGQSGLLRRSIYSKVAKAKGSGKVLAVIGPKRGMKINGANPTKYAHLVEDGTQAHSIMPKEKSNLTFRTKAGKWLKLKEVNHPGSVGSKFLRRASVFAGQAAVKAFRNKVTADVIAQAAKRKPVEIDDGN